MMNIEQVIRIHEKLIDEFGDVIKTNTAKNIPDWIVHPHSEKDFLIKPNNTIYVAKDKLTFDNNLSGADIFKYSSDIVLTKRVTLPVGGTYH